MSTPHVMERVDTYAMQVDVSYPGWDLGGPRPNVFRRNRVITSPDAKPTSFMQPAPKFTIAEPPREAMEAEIASLKAENTALRRYRTDMFALSLMSGVGFTGIIFLLGSLLP